MTMLEKILQRATSLFSRNRTPPAAGTPAVAQGSAMRWRRRGNGGVLEPVRHLSAIQLDDLLCIERQKEVVQRNTLQFIGGRNANNVLLWGPRGTGKSSLIKAVFNAHRHTGLNIVEMPRELRADLSDLCDRLGDRAGRFIVYCDDLSFGDDDPSYKSIKVALDGSLSATPGNVVIYSTSNRRHLMPEHMKDNRDSGIVDGELHFSENVEEKLSLSERFGIWLAFHPFDQDQYLTIAEHWLARLGGDTRNCDAVRRAALQWALERGSRSGRCAQQFAVDWLGRPHPGPV